MKKKYFGKVTGISHKLDKDGYYKLSIMVTDEYAWSKKKGHKSILIPKEDIYKYGLNEYYLFKVEYSPEVNKVTYGYKQDYKNIERYGPKKYVEVTNSYKYMPYDEYLLTDHWKELRKRIHAKYNNKCAICGSSDNLEVHHITYERKGEELDEDLALLCKKCHMTQHKLI